MLVSAGHEDVVRELVGAGADVNKKTEKGLTPLYATFDIFLYLDPRPSGWGC
jgi:hypothetical protein